MIYVLAVYDLPMGFVLDTLQRQKDINLGPAEQAPILLCREETFGHCKSDARYQNIKRGERVGPKLFESGKIGFSPPSPGRGGKFSQLFVESRAHSSGNPGTSFEMLK